MCVYIYSGEVKTHTRACADTHNILYACMSPELHTYKYGDISSKTVVILPYFVHMFLFRLKRLMLQKGKSKCFSWHSRDNISGAWSQIHPWKQCKEIKICLNAELPTYWKQIFKFIRMGRISVNMGNSLYFVISFQILPYCFWVLKMCYSCYSR